MFHPVKIIVFCGLLAVSGSGCAVAVAAQLCACGEAERWCADYLEGRKAFNVGDLETAEKHLAKAAEAHPGDDCKVKVDNFPERYRPFYYLSSTYLELGDCLLAWDSWERSSAREGLAGKQSRQLAEKLERRCGPCDPACYQRIVARAEEKVGRCRRQAASWPECEGIGVDRRRLSGRCARAEEELQEAVRSHSPALAQQAASSAADAIDQLRALFCRRCDDQCGVREELQAQIDERVREARELRDDPLGARFVQLVETIDSLVVDLGRLPADVPLAELRQRGDELRRALEALQAGLLAAPFPELARGVVKIEASPGPDPETGSGIVVHLEAGRATILTATHVVEGAGKSVLVTFPGRPERRFTAELLQVEAEDPNGLALLAVEGELPPARCLPLADLQPEETQTVYIVGMPRAAETDWAITVGRAAGRKGTKMSLDVPAFGEGNSGGPAILTGGWVVGMVTAKGADGFVLAVPSPFLRYALEGWEVEPCDLEAGDRRGGELP